MIPTCWAVIVAAARVFGQPVSRSRGHSQSRGDRKPTFGHRAKTPPPPGHRASSTSRRDFRNHRCAAVYYLPLRGRHRAAAPGSVRTSPNRAGHRRRGCIRCRVKNRARRSRAHVLQGRVAGFVSGWADVIEGPTEPLPPRARFRLKGLSDHAIERNERLGGQPGHVGDLPPASK